MSSQGHFTLSFPLKSSLDAKAVAGQLPALMPDFFISQNTIGTIHYSLFTVINRKTLLFLGDFDGEFANVMANLAGYAGPVFDAVFQHINNPASVPIADNVDAFLEWSEKHLLRAATLFSAYPDLSAKKIRAMAREADLSGATQQHPFLVILPITSRMAYLEVEVLLRARDHKTQKDLAIFGTPHFAQFIPLGNNQIAFFTVYDGSFDRYIADFTKHIGPVFDLIFKFTKDPPPSPCRKHVQEFIDFAARANHTPIGFYEAYPNLSVQDIHALIADAKAAQSAGNRTNTTAA
jgi:hypothetical protein